MLVCSKCKNEIKMGEIQCSKCGEYIRLGTGRRALYNIMSVAGGIIVPLFVVLICFAVAGEFYEGARNTVAMYLMPWALQICFVFNIITATAMRREYWNKGQDVIMILPTAIYAVLIAVSAVTLILGEDSGLLFIIAYAVLFFFQLWLLVIARKVSKRLKAIKATYDEYYRLKNTK